MQQPIAISSSSSAHSSLPKPLRDLLSLRSKADSLLLSPSLEQELADHSHGPQAQLVKESLNELITAAQSWKDKAQGRKITALEEARGIYMHAWGLSRVGEYDDQRQLSTSLQEALELYQSAADLIKLPTPPTLSSVPSVTRPKDGVLPPNLAEQPAWVGEFLSEWARATTTLAFSLLLQNDDQEVIEEEKLADLLDWSARRNVQALFTPLDPDTVSEESNPSEAGTVLGNATLIKDMSQMYPFTSSSSLWTRRLSWATHVADVRFVEASMSANRLTDAASASASILQKSDTTDLVRHQVRGVLEGTLRRLIPFEKIQAGALLNLGRVMLKCVGELYLGLADGNGEGKEENGIGSKRVRDESRDGRIEEEEGEGVKVPENELVRETRAVFIRAAGLYENVYASFRRIPVNSKTTRQEQRLLRRLEATYCDLEALDNSTPEVVELRNQRVERALWINNRLMELGSENEESGDEEVSSADEGEESDEEEEEMRRRFERQRV